MKVAEKTTREVLAGLTSNTRLQAVLAGQYGDYGLPPKDASFFIHAMVAKHYFEGGAYPVGGQANGRYHPSSHQTKGRRSYEG